MPTLIFHVDDSFTSLRRKAWAHITSLAPPLFIEVAVNVYMYIYIYVLRVSNLPLSTIFRFDFG